MIAEKRCELCIHCKMQNKETGRGLCTEEHQPCNAKGEHKATVYLMFSGCHRWNDGKIQQPENPSGKSARPKRKYTRHPK